MNCRILLKLAGLAGFAIAMASAAAQAESTPPLTLQQGPNWDEATKSAFYSLDQGSRLIPYAWIAALKQPNGEPFLAGNLDRYGYLSNERSATPGLPVGFVVANEGEKQTLGLTCAACHTRQIQVEGKSYRIDGGPAIADLGAFWGDLDRAVGKILSESAAFDEFAQRVSVRLLRQRRSRRFELRLSRGTGLRTP